MPTPPRQYEVERELRERIKMVLDARGIATTRQILTVAGQGAGTGPASSAAGAGMAKGSGDGEVGGGPPAQST
jgi:hypothetical protein